MLGDGDPFLIFYGILLSCPGIFTALFLSEINYGFFVKIWLVHQVGSRICIPAVINGLSNIHSLCYTGLAYLR
jgi:hypothetical protein